MIGTRSKTTERERTTAPRPGSRIRRVGAWLVGIALAAGVATATGLVLSDDGATPVPVAPAVGVGARDAAAVAAAERYQQMLEGQAADRDEALLQSSDRVWSLYFAPSADKEEALLQGARRYEAAFGRTP